MSIPEYQHRHGGEGHNHPEDCHLQSLRYPFCGCDFHHHDGPCKEITRVAGLSTVVVDDLNQVAYIYGNILHEDNHMPSHRSCQPYIKLPIDMVAQPKFTKIADELFYGEYPENTITLEHHPIKHELMLVYLNGIKQIAGDEHDFRIVGPNQIKFNFYDLVETDNIEVIYKYIEV